MLKFFCFFFIVVVVVVVVVAAAVVVIVVFMMASQEGQTIYVGNCFGHDNVDGEKECVSEVNIIVSKATKPTRKS